MIAKVFGHTWHTIWYCTKCGAGYSTYAAMWQCLSSHYK